jgi:hypothetical protein
MAWIAQTQVRAKMTMHNIDNKIKSARQANTGLFKPKKILRRHGKLFERQLVIRDDDGFSTPFPFDSFV